MKLILMTFCKNIYRYGDVCISIYILRSFKYYYVSLTQSYFKQNFQREKS